MVTNLVFSINIFQEFSKGFFFFFYEKITTIGLNHIKPHQTTLISHQFHFLLFNSIRQSPPYPYLLPMATVLRTPTFRPSPTLLTTAATSSNHSRTSRVSVASSRRRPSPLKSHRFSSIPTLRFAKLVPFAFDGDTEAPQVQDSPEVQVLVSLLMYFCFVNT